MFKRPLSQLANRFHAKQTEQWLAYKAGMTCVLPWGRRSGKSDFFAEVLIEDVEDHYKPCLYLASTQDSAREIMWPKMRERLKGNDKWKLQDSILEAIYKPENVPVRFRGIEKADNLPGKAYRLVIADEFALWKKDPKLIVKQVLAPMIADYNGQIMYGSSKRGKNHFYELHLAALKNHEKYFVNECTMFENPYMSEQGRRNLLSEYEGADDPLYRQEVLNEYVTFQGMAFALPQDSYTERRWDPADFDHSYHWRGVDHGFSPDPTACVWIAYNKRKAHWIVYQEYKRAQLLISHHAKIINGLEPYHYVNSYSDVDPQLIAEYAAVGLVMSPAQKADKNARILRIVTALKTGKLKIAHNCTELLREMQNYEWEQDGNDHLIDALIYGFTNAAIPAETIAEEKEDYRLSDRSSGEWDGQSFD